MKGTLGLAAALLLAALAGACGPSTPQTPTTPTAEPSAMPGATPSATPSGEPGPAGTTAPTGGPKTGPAAGGAPSQPIVASKLLEDVKKVGIDLAKAPDIGKLPMDKKKKVMPILQKALGYDACTGCHVEGDMKAETHNKKVAREMWNHFVVGLRDEKGGPLFCDSCHNGKNKVLNRGDKEAVKKFMETEYEGKLSRSDKKEHACSTCHGESMEVAIIDKLWKIPK